MSGNRLVARNVAVTIATQLLSWALAFAVTLYLPRYVGDTGLGKLAFATSFVAIFGSFVSVGTTAVLVKEIARDRTRLGELLAAAIVLRIPIGLAMMGFTIFLVWVLGYPALTRTLVAVTALGMLAATLNDALAAALRGQENMTRQGLGIVVEKFLTSALIIALIFHKAPLWQIAGVGFLTGIASLLVNLSAFRGLLGTLRMPDLTALRSIALAGVPYMGWGVFKTLYGQTDPVVLNFLTNDATVGWYAAAWRLLAISLVLPNAISTAVFPTMARLYATSVPEFQALTRRAMALVMLCGVPVAFLLILMPDRLIHLMHYPREFDHTIPVLRIGGIGVFLYFAADLLGAVVIACDGQKHLVRASIGASIVGIPACFAGSFLTHYFWHNGAIGAMASDVMLEIGLVAFYIKVLPTGTFTTESAFLIGRYLIASIPMAALLAVASPTGIGLWVVIPCGIAYLAMCWLLRCFDPQDLMVIRSAIARRAGYG